MAHPPNVPPVTVHQIIRYLGNRYALCMKAGRAQFRNREAATTPGLYRIYDQNMRAYYHDAQVLRSVARHLHHGHIPKWCMSNRTADDDITITVP